jgi:hypothetical protein
VKRGGRALLCGAITVALLCSAALAQSTVSLVGINAGQDANAAVIELHTSAPADFILDRFTMGQWLTVWSSKFELADGIKEIPLEFERAELADMVTGMSLVRARNSGAIRIYLGAGADARAAEIRRDGNLTVIRVPLKSEHKLRTANFKSSFAVRSKDETPAPQQDEMDVAADMGAATEDADEVTAGSSGSFRSNNQSSLMARADKPVSANLDLGGRSIAALMEDTARLVNDSSSSVGSGSSSASSNLGASGEFYRPFQGAMKPTTSFGAVPVANAMPVDGKDTLRGVKIDTYQIMSTPLDQALTLLVAPTGFNVIVGDGFGDKVVSLSFQKGTTDLRSALDMMTRANGLDYVVQAGTIVIGTKETLYGGLIDFETRVFVLNYAEPRSVKQMLLQTGLVEQNQVEIYSERPTGAGGAGQALSLIHI